MLATIVTLLAQAETHVEEETNDAKDLYPHCGRAHRRARSRSRSCSSSCGSGSCRGSTPCWRSGVRRSRARWRTPRPPAMRPTRSWRSTGSSSPARARRRTASSRRRGGPPSSCAGTLETKAEEESQAHRRPRAGRDPGRARPCVPGAPRAGRRDRRGARRPGSWAQSLDDDAHQRLIDEYIDEVATRPTATGQAADVGRLGGRSSAATRRRSSSVAEAEGALDARRGRALRLREGRRARSTDLREALTDAALPAEQQEGGDPRAARATRAHP